MPTYFTCTIIVLALSLPVCIPQSHSLVRRDDKDGVDSHSDEAPSDISNDISNDNAQHTGESRNIAQLMSSLGPMIQQAAPYIQQAGQVIGGAIQSGIQSAITSAMGSVNQAVSDQMQPGDGGVPMGGGGGMPMGGGGGMTMGPLGGMPMGGGGGDGLSMMKGMLGGRRKRSPSQVQVSNDRPPKSGFSPSQRLKRHVSTKILIDSPYNFKDQTNFRTSTGMKSHRLELIDMKNHVKFKQ